MTQPWWDQVMPLIVIVKILYYCIPILTFIFVIFIYKDIKRILKYLPKNEKDRM